MIAADGKLTAQSALADSRAYGSTATVDYFGTQRPLGGTVPDIGAFEGLNVPVELSQFNID